jgi:uncharacterized protein DUF973
MAFPPAQGTAPPYAAPVTTGPSRSDLDGVGNLKVAALLGLIVQAMIWIGFAIFDLIFTSVQSATNAGNGLSTLPGWITVNTLYVAVGLLAGGLVIGIVSYIFFYLGFRAVKRGAPDFGAPTTLVMIGLIGFAMTALGLIVVVGAVVTAINSVSSGAVSSISLGAVLGGLALIGLGLLLALIGVIGLVLGNWRAGKRYDETSLKIGAILTILPYVSIVGYILLLVGYVRAGKKLESGWSPPVMMGMGMPYAAPGMAPGYPMGTPPMAAPTFQTPPPAAPAAAAPTCPKCGQPGTWVAQYSRWYCYTDQQYL